VTVLGEDILYLSATDLGMRLRSRQVSPVELAEGYLARIDRLAPKLNAFVTVTRDRALAQARQAEKEIAAGKVRGPLHGVPYATKDLLAIKGVRTTWGATPFSAQSFDYDATLVRRLQEAGAVLLGTLAMIELAGGLGYTVPWASATGAARNPWDTGKWSCGSSSGSGAAVSAALVGFAIGSDTWGSIICPSSFCGIAGVRPTFGRVSRRGAMALSWTMDKLGPMARSTEDCEAVLAAIAGHDALDDWSADEPPPRSLPAAASRTLKVGCVRPDFAKKGEKEVEAAFDQAIGALRDAGVSVQDAKLPDLPFEEVAGLVIRAEAASAFEALFRDGRVRQMADPAATISNASARAISAGDYVKALRIRTLCQKAMAEVFSELDLLVSPAEMMTAPPADESLEGVEWSDPVGGMSTLCGLPAISVPCGFGRGGLPVGLTIVAGAFEEGKMLALAKLYQSVTGWHRRHPPIA
jgi:aspartyl-tRNA(Asn)/glutamyl-tRNA(Gln) amidotransferase subunit A